ncbi:MAG: MFS transporter [Bryobacterales bacterium]|nr:MFS transporter [Bryobacterales bacterium]
MEQSIARKGLIGFFLSGLLMSLLGALLPAWRHHIEPDFLIIAAYFLFQNIGLLAALYLAHRLIPRRGIRFGVILGSSLACVSLLFLALVSPPAFFAWRLLGLAGIGVSAGILNATSFNAMTAAYELDPAATLNIAGALWGLGCLVSALFLAGTFFIYSVQSILILLSLIPGFAALLYYRSSFPSAVFLSGLTWSGIWSQFRSPSAILMALFLFFQFGNEWAIAGWLPIFLVLRLGMSPGTALVLLSVYWLSLLVGRVLAQWALPRVSHTRLLGSAAVAPLLGCLILFSTNNLFGAVTGVLLTGGGFSVIFPLAAERIGKRFPGFHPGFFNGIFSLAVTGGLLAPASLGVFAASVGVGVVMGVPLVGTIMVLILLFLIQLDARLTGVSDA